MQFLFLALLRMINAQTVDSIRVEQTGDLVKIHYKILNSNPNQIFRITVLCSMNGGLKSVLNSLSGDYGNNVIGGRNDYMVLWDVLKDVSELRSAEFFVQAELIKDLSVKPAEVFDTTRFWASKRIITIVEIDVPGPSLGFRIGYLGSFGISGRAFMGNIKVFDEYKSNASFVEPDARFGAGLDLTKRIISKNAFQMHLLAGYRNNDIMVYHNAPPAQDFWYQGVGGIEFGAILAAKRLLIDIEYYQFNPKQLESKIKEPVTLICPNKYFSFGVGVRF